MRLNQPLIQRAAEADAFDFEERCHITEWLNTELDPAASVVRAAVAPGVTTRWHRLKGITERYVILSGEGDAEVGESSPCRVSPGDVVVIPAGAAQRITNPGPDELVFLAVCTPRFTSDAYEDIDPDSLP